ncbi:hypothetical protein ACHQM5_015761 [Ranunculus cassubicifolius]
MASATISCTNLSSFTLRSSNFIKISSTSLPIRNSRPKSTAIKATGTVKYKGTQMREQQLTEMIEKKILEAKEVCEADEKSDGCKVAWDEVEEVSRAKAVLRKRLEKEDPLEYYCGEHPEEDECRIYED